MIKSYTLSSRGINGKTHSIISILTTILRTKLGNFDQRSPLIDVFKQHDDESPVKLSSTVIALCKRLIDIGGKATLLFRDYSGHDTVLHHLCRRNIIDMDLMKKMVRVGGEKLVLATCQEHATALHYICDGHANIKAVKLLTSVGGKKLVLMPDEYGRTALHCACSYLDKKDFKLEVALHLIQLGGEKLVKKIDCSGFTVLHDTVFKPVVDLELFNRLIEVGRRKLVLMKNSLYKQTAYDMERNKRAPNQYVLDRLREIGGK